MKQIRQNVWETNSSSTHSFSISYDCPLEESNLSIDEDGYIRLPMIGFCSTETYWQQEEKLTYVIQLCAMKNGAYLNKWVTERVELDKQLDILYKCQDFKDIEEEIKAYVGPQCQGIRFASNAYSGYIDDGHDYYDMNEFYEDCGGLIRFVFGTNSMLHYEYRG